jgi:hypothetical protein
VESHQNCDFWEKKIKLLIFCTSNKILDPEGDYSCRSDTHNEHYQRESVEKCISRKIQAIFTRARKNVKKVRSLCKQLCDLINVYFPNFKIFRLSITLLARDEKFPNHQTKFLNGRITVYNEYL